MKIRLTISLVFAGLLAFVMLIGCGEEPDRVVSPDNSSLLINGGLATGFDQPVVGDESTGDTYDDDEYVDDGTTDLNLPDDDGDDDPIVEEGLGSEVN